MSQIENSADNPPSQEPSPKHYGRDSLQERIDKLERWQLNHFEGALSGAKTGLVELKNCIESENLLPDDQVESCMRELALIISGIHAEFDRERTNEEKVRELNIKVREFIKKYDF